METNPIKKLSEINESIWLDNLSRNLIDSGELERLIFEDGVTGVTSNPTIFQKAISGSKDYNASLRKLLEEGLRDEKELFWRLATEDVSRAAQLFWPVYLKSGGLDGYISIEVSPDLAHDSERTVAEAKRLFSGIGRKNILIKVPGTKEGLAAIEELTGEGVNINVTLLFSVIRYEEVVDAYLRGLEKRFRMGKPIDEVVSVASFFVSRVDTLVDKLLEARMAAAGSEDEKQKIKSLMGKAAVANAKLAYKKYRETFSAERFRSLPKARVQRILWGSTGTKNPAYSDVKYVEELIGYDSINTLPDSTLKAFRDHGRTQVTIDKGVKEAESLFPQLKELGIDIDRVTEDLEKEGVKLFSDSFFALLKEIAQKRDSFLAEKG
ncbi:MAG: transaldolase [Syntrophaceae bacterium]|nr:transaldolase [Syntrophaceae bacterium]